MELSVDKLADFIAEFAGQTSDGKTVCEIFGEIKFLHQLGIIPIFPVAVVFFKDVLRLQLPKAGFVRPKNIVDSYQSSAWARRIQPLAPLSRRMCNQNPRCSCTRNSAPLCRGWGNCSA